MDAQLHLSNIEAERVVLGGLIMGGYQTSSITQFLVVDDFYREGHSILYQTIMDMLAENIAIELPAVVSKLISSQQIDKVGGTNYVANLINQTASLYNLDYYGTLIKESAQKRALLKNLKEIEQKLLTEDIPLPEMFDFAESRLFEVTQSAESKDWQDIASVLGKEFVRIQNLIENRNEVSGMDTGFIDLNKILAGFQRTDLIVLAARPAMGKTALALNFMLAVAREGVGDEKKQGTPRGRMRSGLGGSGANPIQQYHPSCKVPQGMTWHGLRQSPIQCSVLTLRNMSLGSPS